jgi:RNA polymerase sigma-70 factor, ECF subfamily
VTLLLGRVRDGDVTALDELTPLVYEQLHRIATGCMSGERAGHTMQATALVNEAWLRLAGQQANEYRDRTHFLGFAARLMRQILVDHARGRQAAKRDGGVRVEWSEAHEARGGEAGTVEVLAMHEALERLARENESRARLIEMRYFAGMKLEEIAAVSEMSVASVHRELRVAQAWMRREMRGEA